MVRVEVLHMCCNLIAMTLNLTVLKCFFTLQQRGPDHQAVCCSCRRVGGPTGQVSGPEGVCMH